MTIREALKRLNKALEEGMELDDMIDVSTFFGDLEHIDILTYIKTRIRGETDGLPDT